MRRSAAILLNISSCVKIHEIAKRDESERPTKRLIESEHAILRPLGGYKLVETIQNSGMCTFPFTVSSLNASAPPQLVVCGMCLSKEPLA